MIKKLLNLFTIAFVVIAITSCASTKISKNPATITKAENAMFWEINGTDKNGNPSKLYVLGTIHVGDDRLYPIPENIEAAFIDADILVGEISSEGYSALMPETLSRQSASAQKEAARIAETGKKLSDYLTPDQLTLAKLIVGGDAAFANYELFEPWVLSSVLTMVPIATSGFDPTKGYDAFFVARSGSEGRPMEGLDELSTQLDIVEYGDWETQLLILKESLDDLLENQEDPGKDIKELYEAYLTSDEEKLSEIMFTQLNEETADYKEDYNKVVFTDRNINWAEKFTNYLNEGGTTFIFAGCGHFVGPESVFVYMEKNGDLVY